MPATTSRPPRRTARGRPTTPLPPETVEVAIDALNIKKDPALSLPDACAYCGGLSEVYLRRLTAQGVIPSVLIGRRRVYLISDLDTFLAARRRPV